MSATATLDPNDTPSGISNAKLGTWLFLASEVMLFSTLFTTYIVLRTAAPSWPRGWEVLNVPLATFNTIVLITSSVTMVMAYARAVEGNKAGFRRHMWATILLGLVFLVVKGFEYGAHFRIHEYPSTNIFTAIYFTLTGLHCIHIIGGLVFNAALLYMSGDGFDHPLFVGRIEGAGLYWHFVDIVWIFLFPALYLSAHAHSAPNVKLYMAIFGTLMVMTVVTVLVSHLHLPHHLAIALALVIATFKATLVAAFFMHLKGEKTLIYGLLGLSAFFLILLYAIPISDSALLSDRMEHTPVVMSEEGGH